MGYWKIIRPAATTNLILNPRGKTLDGWSGVTNTVEVSYERGKAGVYSIKVEITDASSPHVFYSQSYAIPPGNYYFSAYIWSPNAMSLNLRTYVDGTVKTDTNHPLPSRRWHRIAVEVRLDAAANAFKAEFTAPAGSVFYIDALQLEGGRLTTYIDGDLEEGEWLGANHRSPSHRPYRAGMRGGEIVDLEEAGLHIQNWSGLGIPQQKLTTTPSPSGVGAAWWQVRTKERELVLVGMVKGQNLLGLHAARRVLSDILGFTLAAGAMLTLVYTGTGQDIFIPAVYIGGWDFGQFQGNMERFALKFVTPRSYLYEDNAEQVLLELPRTITAPYVAARVEGAWKDIAQAFDEEVYGLVRGPDGWVYAYGKFTSITQVDGTVVSAARLARYNDATGEWQQVGPGLNGPVRGVFFAPDGYMYAYGEFTATADGSQTLRYITAVAGGSFLDLHGGVDFTVYDVDWDDTTSSLVVVGYFSKINVGTADETDAIAIARWTPDAWLWTAVEPQGTYPGQWDNLPVAVAVDREGNIYIGGYFTTVPAAGGGNKDADHVAWNDGNDWYPMAAGFDDAVYAVYYASDGYVYAGGKFRRDGDHASLMRGVARWNGYAWEELQPYGIDGEVWEICENHAHEIVVSGKIWRAGDIRVVDGIAIWKRTAFVPLDIDFRSASQTVVSAHADRYGNLWVSGDTNDGAVVSTVTHVLNQSSTPIRPHLFVRHMRLLALYNHTTGRIIYFDIYATGWVQVDLEDGRIRYAEMDSFGKILPGSDVGRWVLVPGVNRVSIWAVPLHGDTIPSDARAILRWRTQHLTVDGAL